MAFDVTRKNVPVIQPVVYWGGGGGRLIREGGTF